MHHIFIRATERSLIAIDDADYERALFFLEHAASQFEIQCHAWCYLPNHYHLLVTSRLGNISATMQWLGTCTAQSFNKRHERQGHLFKARFESRLVENDEYMLELARYLPLNPVRAGLTTSAVDWPWSSYAATTGRRVPPWFLSPDAFMDTLDSRDAYTSWVDDGVFSTFLDEHGVPRPPPRPSLNELLADISEGALASAHFRHGYSKAEIARHLGVSRHQIRRRLGPAT
jgi:REP element-mobilizing transposase RayT